jgi:hypothetical protein
MSKSRDKQVFPGAEESTPSRAQYFTWVNNNGEGATDAQTRANLAFFRWLHDEYGMVLDIYAFDAGAIDGAGYGSTDSERFHRQFPQGFGPLVEIAQQAGTRLGVWGGPDGFGDTAEEEKKRIQMMVDLCRRHHFALFKFDAMCGGLRPEKQDAFVRQMTECRRYSPDLILLNHRLELGKGMPHATTFLWEGEETYIDVHMVNETPAPHNRACVLARGLVPGLQRLCEDHGVCLSSCLDYWEDDLVLQAFNRCLILAPEIYGNPWLLRDEEFPRLARIYNLHRRYRRIMVKGRVLSEEQYGPLAVARGDADTRLLTLRNLTWKPVRRVIALDKSIGLKPGKGDIEVRQFHPTEQLMGKYAYGASLEIEVLPFRACLLLVTRKPCEEPGVEGCAYEVVRDVPGKPLVIKLLGEPGARKKVRLHTPNRTFRRATLDGVENSALLRGKTLSVSFPGKKLTQPWHRLLGALTATPVPADAEALYEATCFAADNNALEVRELQRSGPTAIAQVSAAREAFFQQTTFRQRFVSDAGLFDDDADTGLGVSRHYKHSPRGGAFRLDLGRLTRIDHLRLECGGPYFVQPLKWQGCTGGAVSADLRHWQQVRFYVTGDLEGALPGTPVRFVRLDTTPDLVREVRGCYQGKSLSRTGWRASNLFPGYGAAPAVQAWSLKFRLNEAAPGAYLALAVHGEFGTELVTAALRNSKAYIGAPRRSPSFPSNAWEYPVLRTGGNYTYYFPVTPELLGRDLEAVVLLLKGGKPQVRPELWITSYPQPYAAREVVLE